MMSRLLGAVLGMLLLTGHAEAQTQPGCVQVGVPCTSVAGFFPTGAADLAASSVSARVAFPTTGSNLIAVVQNTGAVTAYVVAGNSSVTATTAGTPVLPGGTVLVPVALNTYIAGITASGSTSLTVQTGTGQPALMALLGGVAVTAVTSPNVSSGDGMIPLTNTTAVAISSVIQNNSADPVWPTSGNLSGQVTFINAATSATTVAICPKGPAGCTCPSNGSATTTGREIAPGASWSMNLTGTLYTTPIIVECSAGNDFIGVSAP